MEEWQQVSTWSVIIEGTIMESMSRYGKNLLFYYTEGDRYLGQWRQGIQQGVGTLFRCNLNRMPQLNLSLMGFGLISTFKTSGI